MGFWFIAFYCRLGQAFSSAALLLCPLSSLPPTPHLPRPHSKGKDLPLEFLEGIYKSIQEHPILSFDARPEGSDMTVDRWRDLLKQAEADPDTYGLLVCHEPGANDDEDEDEDKGGMGGPGAERIASPPPSLASPTAAAAMGSSARLAAEAHARRHGYAAYDRCVRALLCLCMGNI